MVDPEKIDSNINLILNMKIQTDNMNTGNKKPKFEIGVLYRRFIICCRENVIPVAEQLKLNENGRRKLQLLKDQVSEAEQSLNEIIYQLKQQQ